MKRRNYDNGILDKLAQALGVDPEEQSMRDCQADGHSFDRAINEKVGCSICGKTQAEVEGQARSGEYQYEFIKYLDREG